MQELGQLSSSVLVCLAANLVSALKKIRLLLQYVNGLDSQGMGHRLGQICRFLAVIGLPWLQEEREERGHTRVCKELGLSSHMLCF